MTNTNLRLKGGIPELCREDLREPGAEEFILKVLRLPLSPKGEYPADTAVTPGGACIGQVVALGVRSDEIYEIGVGDTVYLENNLICGKCKYCVTGHYSACETALHYGAGSISGTAADYVLALKGSRVHKLPEPADLDVFSLMSAAELAVSALLTKGSCLLGDSLLIVGFDLFGFAAALLARQNGLTPVIAVDPAINGEKRRLAELAGIALYPDMGSFGGQRFTMVLDSLSDSGLFSGALDSILPLGRYVIVGKNGAVSLPVDKLAAKEVALTGIHAAAWGARKAALFLSKNSALLSSAVTFAHFSLTDLPKALAFAKDNLWSKQVILCPND